MVFGGLPYFFSLLNPDESLNWNIDALIFKAFMNFIEEKIKTVATPFAFWVWLRFLHKNGRKIKILPK